MTEGSNTATRGIQRLYSLFGVSSSAISKLSPEPVVDTVGDSPSGSFSKSEMGMMLYVTESNRYDNSIGAVRQILEGTANSTAKTINNNKSFKSLTPELGKAKSILIPSIMSPNDLQSESFNISVEVPDFSPETNSQLSKLLHDYFNNELCIGEKVSQWIGNALFENGSQPVLVIPKAMVRVLAEATAADYKKMNSGKTSKVKIKPSTEDITVDGSPKRRILTTERILPKKSDLFVGVESIIPATATVNKVVNDGLIIEAMEKAGGVIEAILNMSDPKDNLTKESLYADIKPGLESCAKEIFSQLKGSPGSEALVGVSHDYRNIIDPIATTKKQSSKAMNAINKAIYGDGVNKMLVMHTDDPLEKGDHPSIMALPAESVIPVTIPGDPSAHFGYFVLVDEKGTPITADEVSDSTDDCLNKQVIKSGGNVISGFTTKGMTNGQKYEAANLVYDLIVKRMLSNELGQFDLDNVSIRQHQAISNCMFQRFLRGQKIRTVFVPADLMVYYAFDYRKDGTGKSLLEDSAFILSMRSTLYVANIMAALKASAERKKITFNLGNEATNHEQVAETLHELYVQKNLPAWGTDPLAVARDIVSRNISIIPKGLKGLSEFDVQTEVQAGASVKPDSDMIDVLTKQIISMTTVPYTALNQVSENEYSRSIATNNLFFANNVREKQKPTQRKTSELIRTYIRLSYSLTNKIVQILNDSETVKNDVDAVNTEDPSIIAEEGAQLFEKVIKHINVTLPSPNMAFNKAQYEETMAQLESLNKVIEQIFNADIIKIEAKTDSDMIVAIGQHIKAKCARAILNAVGMHRDFNIPELDDVDLSEFQGTQRFARNLRAMVNSLDILSKPVDPNTQGATPSGDSGEPAPEGTPSDTPPGSADQGATSQSQDDTGGQPTDGSDEPPENLDELKF
jgi:hypothetical protein